MQIANVFSALPSMCYLVKTVLMFLRCVLLTVGTGTQFTPDARKSPVSHLKALLHPATSLYHLYS